MRPNADACRAALRSIARRALLLLARSQAKAMKATVYVPAASSIKSSLYWPMVSLIPYGITGPFRARWGRLGW